MPGISTGRGVAFKCRETDTRRRASVDRSRRGSGSVWFQPLDLRRSSRRPAILTTDVADGFEVGEQLVEEGEQFRQHGASSHVTNPFGPLDARELARLRIPGDEARDEQAGADIEDERAPGPPRRSKRQCSAATICLPTPGLVREAVADLKLHRQNPLAPLISQRGGSPAGVWSPGARGAQIRPLVSAHPEHRPIALPDVALPRGSPAPCVGLLSAASRSRRDAHGRCRSDLHDTKGTRVSGRRTDPVRQARAGGISSASKALSDLVLPTVDEKERALLGAQNTRPPTIEVGQKPVAEDDGVLRRDHPRAVRARRGLLFRHRSTPDPKGMDQPDAIGAGRRLASTQVLQW